MGLENGPWKFVKKWGKTPCPYIKKETFNDSMWGSPPISYIAKPSKIYPMNSVLKIFLGKIYLFQCKNIKTSCMIYKIRKRKNERNALFYSQSCSNQQKTFQRHLWDIHNVQKTSSSGSLTLKHIGSMFIRFCYFNRDVPVTSLRYS